VDGLGDDFALALWSDKIAACDDLYARITAVRWMSTYNGMCYNYGAADPVTGDVAGDCDCLFGVPSGTGCNGDVNTCQCSWDEDNTVDVYAGYFRDICHQLGTHP